MTPFDYVRSVSETKEDLLAGDSLPLFKKSYSPWIVNKALSGFMDCVLFANEMNTRQLDPNQQYLYYLNIIPSRKRWAKWMKKENGSDIEIVRKYYSYSYKKAKQALQLLSSEQLEQIRKRVEDVK